MILNGKVAFVTGGSRGLGKAICEALVAEGAFVFFTYRVQKERAEDMAKQSPNLEAIPLDIRNFSAVSSTVQNIISRKGRIDILVNNAEV